jgi:glutaredoxin
MNNTILPITAIFLAIVGLGIFGLSGTPSSEATRDDSDDTSSADISKMDMTLFYGIGCPHCEVVDEYIEDNNIMDSLEFESKEIYYNKENADKLAEIAKHCGITTNIGVPFMWTGETCFIGAPDIINFLASETISE